MADAVEVAVIVPHEPHEDGTEKPKPPIAWTTDLALAAWWWTRGLEFSRCIATDPEWAELEFDDPHGLAPRLEEEFRQQRELRDVLKARRRLCYAIRTARVSPSRIATRQNIDRPDPRLRPALVADALKHRMEAR